MEEARPDDRAHRPDREVALHDQLLEQNRQETLGAVMMTMTLRMAMCGSKWLFNFLRFYCAEC